MHHHRHPSSASQAETSDDKEGTALFSLSSQGRLSIQDSSRLNRHAARVSVLVTAFLIMIKMFGWVHSGSVGILSSLADSGMDLLAALSTYFAVRRATIPPDEEHPFGHGKIEAFASLLQAGLIFASAALIGREAVSHLITPHPITLDGADIGIMLVASFMSLGLVIVQTRIARKTGSVAIHGDKMHYLTDIGCNLVVLLDLVIVSFIKEPRIDAFTGLLVVAWLTWGALNVFSEAAKQLMDTQLGPEACDRIIKLAEDDPQVLGVHQLRSRASGPFIHIQMHMDLAAKLSLAEAHKIIIAAEQRILKAFPAADILIHPDPEGEAEPHGGAFAESRLPVVSKTMPEKTGPKS